MGYLPMVLKPTEVDGNWMGLSGILGQVTRLSNSPDLQHPLKINVVSIHGLGDVLQS